MATAAIQEIRQSASLERLAGPLVAFLKDADTLDVCVNADGRIWVNRVGSGFTEEKARFHTSQAELLLQGVATIRKIEFDHDHPILETVFPLTGDRIEGIISPVVSGAVIAIRTRPKKVVRLFDSAAGGVLTGKGDPRNQKRRRDGFLDEVRGQNHLDVIRAAARHRRNILLVGPTGSGKTTMGSGIIAEWANATPGDRVVMIEDTPELQCSLPNHVQLVATADVSQARLLTASLRLIPKRLVVGEVREEEPARVLLSAWNTGHSGGLATIHANDSMSGLRKLESLIGGHAAAVRERIAEAVQVVIFIDADDEIEAGRKVREVMVVTGFDAESGDYAVEYV